MKLPPQVAAVAREGRSWPARRSSGDGVSASFRHDVKVCPRTRHDINVCRGDANNWKCNFDQNYQVCSCGSGVCQCCKNGCTFVDGNCKCN
jgi:hypothetical protein